MTSSQNYCIYEGWLKLAMCVVSVLLMCVVTTSYSRGNREKIAFFWEELIEDAQMVCEKVKEYAEKIRNESIDAIDEISLSIQLDDDLGARADRYISYQSDDIMKTCLQCLQEKSGSLNETETSASILERSKLLTEKVNSWAELFEEKAQNIITASRDIYRQAVLTEGSNEEAMSDAKDSKEEIKLFAQVIIDEAEDLREYSCDTMKDINEEFNITTVPSSYF